MTPDERRQAIKAIRFSGDEKFYRQCLRIKDKDGHLVPLELNKAQQHIQAEIQDQLKRIGKVRKILLKGRQQGGSTFVGGRFYKRVTDGLGKTAYILSHEAKTTGKLLQMVKRYHQYCPKAVRPRLGKDSANMGLGFPGIDATYELGTAGNSNTGRGTTIHLLHGSEVAFWPDGENILSGVLQAVPNSDDTEVVLESTANGVGGVFYQYVTDARAGEGEYELIFVPWYWQDEYRVKKLPPDFRRTAEEEQIARIVANHPDGSKYNFVMDDRQFMWRRHKVRELKSLDKFKQEYPFTIDEAFLFSGRPAFDVNYCLAAQARCRVPVKVYEVRIGTRELVEVDPSRFNVATVDIEGQQYAKGYKFKDVAGYLQVWSDPVEGGLYHVGADVAEGLAHGDYSAFDVNNASGVQVAHYHGHIDPDLFGVLLDVVGRHYNDAYLGVERNNHGLTTLKSLERLNYPNLHMEQELTKEGEAEKWKLGWYTSTSSKPYIIDQMNGELREENSGIQCLNTIEQCFTYVIDEKGRTNAREGCFDDNVMSYAITMEMGRRRPKPVDRPVTGRSQNTRPKDWRTQ